MRILRPFLVFVAALMLMTVVSVLPATTVSALDVPAPPHNTAIVDNAGIIDDATEKRISQKLIDYKNKTGNEIAVLTVKSLEGEDSFDYSQRVASQWGVGSREANNGALLFVALKERKVFIQVGRGLEPALTDLQTNLIIRQKITPEFKKNNYSAGIEHGIDSMMSVIGGERLSGSASSNKNNSSAWGNLVYIALFPLMYLGSFLARSKSWWAGGVVGAVPGVLTMIFGTLLVGGIVLVGGIGLGLLLDYILSRNYEQRRANGNDTTWWGSGGGFFGGSGGSGGGGFGGFGGGSFGGGGSGGSW